VGRIPSFPPLGNPDSPSSNDRGQDKQEYNVHVHAPLASNAPPTKHITPLIVSPTIRLIVVTLTVPSANSSVASPIIDAAVNVWRNRA
jgi:hypothetical protein